MVYYKNGEGRIDENNCLSRNDLILKPNKWARKREIMKQKKKISSLSQQKQADKENWHAVGKHHEFISILKYSVQRAIHATGSQCATKTGNRTTNKNQVLISTVFSPFLKRQVIQYLDLIHRPFLLFVIISFNQLLQLDSYINAYVMLNNTYSVLSLCKHFGFNVRLLRLTQGILSL